MFNNYYFTGELGKELLYLREYSLLGKLPLTGMGTSHEWLNYGPFYYWFMLPLYNLFHGNPYILIWVSLFTFFVGIILNYVVVKKIFNNKVAVYSTLFFAISPLILWQTYLSKLHTFFFVLSPILILLLYGLWKKDRKYVLWTGLIFGLMFSFHFSQIPLLLVILGVLYIKKYKFYDYVTLIFGIVIPNLGILINNWKIFLWIPYRSAIYSVKSILDTPASFNEYFGRNFFWNEKLWLVGSILFIFIFLSYIKKNRDKFRTDFPTYYLISSISIVLIANFLHGAPPIHYFLPIFTTAPILIADHLQKMRYGFVALIIIFLINLNGYFQTHVGDDYVPFDKQIDIAKKVIDVSGGESFRIERIGPYDYFPENYSQNYKYLIYYYGGNLRENSENKITINENNNFSITKE